MLFTYPGQQGEENLRFPHGSTWSPGHLAAWPPGHLATSGHLTGWPSFLAWPGHLSFPLGHLSGLIPSVGKAWVLGLFTFGSLTKAPPLCLRGVSWARLVWLVPGGDRRCLGRPGLHRPPGGLTRDPQVGKHSNLTICRLKLSTKKKHLAHKKHYSPNIPCAWLGFRGVW